MARAALLAVIVTLLLAVGSASALSHPRAPRGAVTLTPASAAGAVGDKLAARLGARYRNRDGGMKQAVCPKADFIGDAAQCIVEFRTGRSTWWFSLAGVRPAQLAAKNPNDHATLYSLGNWTRRWVSCPLRGVPGTLTSNNDCGRKIPEDDAYFVEDELVPALKLGDRPGPVGFQFTDSVGYGVAGTFKLTRSGATYVATNALGDSFRYTP